MTGPTSASANGPGRRSLYDGEERTERGRPLQPVHPTEAEQVGTVPDPEQLPGRGSRPEVGCGLVEPEAEHGLGKLRHRKEALDEIAFAPGMERQALHSSHCAPENRKMQSGLVVRGGVHHARSPIAATPSTVGVYR